MVIDLSDDQWGTLEHGHLRAPDGNVYSRRTTRMKRRDADLLVTAGAPIVVYWYAGGQFDWCDGPDARSRWQQLRAAVTSQEPAPRPRQDPQWTVGRWDSADGQPLVVLTAHC